jgi:hypothetical protein
MPKLTDAETNQKRILTTVPRDGWIEIEVGTVNFKIVIALDSNEIKYVTLNSQVLMNINWFN